MSRYQWIAVSSLVVMGISLATATSVVAPVMYGAGSATPMGTGLSALGILGTLVSGATGLWGIIKSGSVGTLLQGGGASTVLAIGKKLISGETSGSVMAADAALAALFVAIISRKDAEGKAQLDTEALRLLGLLTKRINGIVDLTAPDASVSAAIEKLMATFNSEMIAKLSKEGV